MLPDGDDWHKAENIVVVICGQSGEGGEVNNRRRQDSRGRLQTFPVHSVHYATSYISIVSLRSRRASQIMAIEPEIHPS